MEGATGVTALPETKSAAVALAGAIILGSLVGTAMPTRMKAAIGPDWREQYGIQFDPSAATFYVEPAPQDLTPISDPYFAEAYDSRASATDSMPIGADAEYVPAQPDHDGPQLVDASFVPPGGYVAPRLTAAAASDPTIEATVEPTADAQFVAETAKPRLSRVDAAAAAAQQVAQAVEQAQGSEGISMAVH